MSLSNRLAVGTLLSVGLGHVSSAGAAETTDHPLVTRYEGATIEYGEVKEYEEFVLPLAPAKKGALTKTRELKGKITRLTYYLPEKRTSLEIQTNYEKSLKASGFEVLFTCAKNKCGDKWLEAFMTANPTTDGHDMLPGTALRSGHADKQRYTAARLTRPQGDAYVSVLISQGWWKRALVQLDVIEVRAMETDKIVVDAALMSRNVTDTGRVAIYGLLFDTNQAELKPESAEALVEIAKYLAAEPSRRLFVVGHTDAVGGVEANLELSERRAKAVVAALVNQHEIDATRLRPFGVGPLAPVAPNDTDANRAKNRRVELVAQ